MNNKKFFTFFTFLFLGIFINLYSNDNYTSPLRGNELCNSIFSFLDENNFYPKKEKLLTSEQNNFPYNILVKVSGYENSNKNIIFTFFQEDVLTNRKIILDFVKFVKLQNYDFNTIFLFAYGEKENIEKQGMIYGVDSFLQNINTNDDYTSIIVDLSSPSNSVKTSSKGVTTPSWLIQNEYNAYLKYKIDENIPNFYISQIYSYNFFYDRVLTSFFNYEIPTVRLNFNKDNINNELVYSVLKESIYTYKNETIRSWDHHFLMVKFFNEFKKLTEEGTIKIILIIIFTWLAFILLLIFVNIRLKKQAWASLKNIWYSAPISLFIIIISFLVGKNISAALIGGYSNPSNVFTVVCFQIILSIVFVSLYYAVTLIYNSSFLEKSIDYLIIISCFINQSLFILVDISNFPIFMLICLLSILALTVKNNSVHILIFFLMALPLLPYATTLIKYADFESLYNFIVSNKFVPIMISFVIFPSFLVYFRVITSIKRKTNINIFLLEGIITLVMTVIIIVTSVFLTNYINNKTIKQDKIKYYDSYEKIIHLTYEDKYVFEDIIRKLDISFDEQPEQCNISVTSLSSTPILYTENDFDYISENTCMFKIPSNPPQNLSFTYGASAEPSLITVTAIFPTNRQSEYKTIRKVVTIGK